MSIPTTVVTSLADLSQALARPEPCNLQLQTSILSPYSVTLPPGCVLGGRDKNSSILSFSNGDDIGLTADNRVENLRVQTTPAARAIYTHAGLPDMGSIALNALQAGCAPSARGLTPSTVSGASRGTCCTRGTT